MRLYQSACLCQPGLCFFHCRFSPSAGKVVDRHWYDRNKHIFPANRWEVYDADA